jgi:chitinase
VGELGKAVLAKDTVWSANWPVGKNKHTNKFNKNFQKFTNNISFDKL